MKKEIGRNGWFVLILLGGIVLAFLLECVAPETMLSLGLVPRTERGLIGIVAMPFLHGSFAHLVGNLLSLSVLLALMLVFHPQHLIRTVVALILASGVLLWLLGRPAVHVGASGLIYALAAYLMACGFAQRRFLELIAAIAVMVLYGSSLLSGLLPFQPGISWDGHLAGAVAGVALGLGFRSARTEPRQA
jgi:membrane associated rhomboid family serine protease